MNYYNNIDNNNNKKISMINIFMLNVYTWMCLGLAITSMVSWIISKNNFFIYLICNNQFFILSIIFTQLFIIYLLSKFIYMFNTKTTIFLFILYSILTGINLSNIFIFYTSYSIFSVFIITTIMFLSMTIYGYLSSNDLTNIGSLLLMLIIGIFVSSIVNLFIHSSLIIWIISYINVFIFTGLIAFDTQKIKNLSKNIILLEDVTILNRYSILGALILYLDFINLFLSLINISSKIEENKKNNKK